MKRCKISISIISSRMSMILMNLLKIFVPGGGLVTTVGGRTSENKINDEI